ncbi:ESCRT-II subunit protein snf8 [Phlyctochytrium bullatum]|nr:ESCRT-II subunit protein snf8 [Phlyctochytrium bullatum]
MGRLNRPLALLLAVTPPSFGAICGAAYVRKVIAIEHLEDTPPAFQRLVASASAGKSAGWTGDSASVAFGRKQAARPTWGYYQRSIDPTLLQSSSADPITNFVRSVFASGPYRMERWMSGAAEDPKSVVVKEGEKFGNVVLTHVPAPNEAIFKYEHPGFNFLLYFGVFQRSVAMGFIELQGDPLEDIGSRVYTRFLVEGGSRELARISLERQMTFGPRDSGVQLDRDGSNEKKGCVSQEVAQDRYGALAPPPKPPRRSKLRIPSGSDRCASSRKFSPIPASTIGYVRAVKANFDTANKTSGPISDKPDTAPTIVPPSAPTKKVAELPTSVSVAALRDVWESVAKANGWQSKGGKAWLMAVKETPGKSAIAADQSAALQTSTIPTPEPEKNDLPEVEEKNVEPAEALPADNAERVKNEITDLLAGFMDSTDDKLDLGLTQGPHPNLNRLPHGRNKGGDGKCDMIELQAQQLEQLKSQLDIFKENLEEFARKYKKDIRQDPAFRSHFQKMCTSIGVDPLASNKGFWSELLGVGDFYYELGVQVIEICIATRERNGGLMDIVEVKQNVEKMRGKNAQAISEDDIIRSIKNLKPLGSGFEIITVGDRKMVQSVPRELNADFSTVLSLSQDMLRCKSLSIKAGIPQELQQLLLGRLHGGTNPTLNRALASSATPEPEKTNINPENLCIGFMHRFCPSGTSPSPTTSEGGAAVEPPASPGPEFGETSVPLPETTGAVPTQTAGLESDFGLPENPSQTATPQSPVRYPSPHPFFIPLAPPNRIFSHHRLGTPSSAALGPCPCDVTFNLCDVGCCCDPDCAGINKVYARKGGCLAEPDVRQVAPLCSSFVFRVNNMGAMGATTVKNSDGVTCIVFDNSPVKGYFYEDPGRDFEQDSYFTGQFQRIPYNYSVPQYTVGPSFELKTDGTLGNSTMGDPVLLQFPQLGNVYGPMILPASSLTTYCNDGNTVKFMVPESSSCNRNMYSPQSGATMCTNNTYFDANYYLSNYRIVNGLDNTTFIDLSTTQCTEPFSNAQAPCTSLRPVWDATTGACFNLVTSVRFTFFYNVTETGQAVVVGVQARVELGSAVVPRNAGLEASLVTQTFGAYWVKIGTNPRQRSGNPGYIVGMPLLTGTYVPDPYPAVAFYPNPLDGLSLPRDTPLPDSSDRFACSTSQADRVAVTFGEDTSAGCTLWLGIEDMANATACFFVRKRAFEVQTNLGKVLGVNRVGQFGNANATVADDWVTVISKDIGDKTAPSTPVGRCSSVLTSLDIQVLIADFGSLKNPQPGIVGLKLQYTWSTLALRCLRPEDCQLLPPVSGPALVNASLGGGIDPSALPPDAIPPKQKFRLRATVSFLRVPGQGVRPYVPPPPRVVPLLPDDIFYPFRLPANTNGAVGRGTGGRWVAVAGVLALLMAVVL